MGMQARSFVLLCYPDVLKGDDGHIMMLGFSLDELSYYETIYS